MAAKMATMIGDGDVTNLRGGGGGRALGVGPGAKTLRVCPGAKNSRTPDHRLHCLTKSSLTLFTPCPLPDGGKLSLSDR